MSEAVNDDLMRRSQAGDCVTIPEEMEDLFRLCDDDDDEDEDSDNSNTSTAKTEPTPAQTTEEVAPSEVEVEAKNKQVEEDVQWTLNAIEQKVIKTDYGLLMMRGDVDNESDIVDRRRGNTTSKSLSRSLRSSIRRCKNEKRRWGQSPRRVSFNGIDFTSWRFTSNIDDQSILTQP